MIVEASSPRLTQLCWINLTKSFVRLSQSTRWWTASSRIANDRTGREKIAEAAESAMEDESHGAAKALNTLADRLVDPLR